MRKTLLALGSVCVLGMPQLFAQTQQRPEKCGMETLHKAMIAEDPAWEAKLQAQKASQQAIADNYMAMQQHGELQRTTTTAAVPVIFHIIVTAAQLNAMGGTAGIIKRCDSQIVVLNRDFNAENPDSTAIPSAWKALYGNSGIRFGLAHVDPTGACSPGYEIKVVTKCGFTDESRSFRTAKVAATGLASWDVTKYYNVWCINYVSDTTACAATDLLGITIPKGSTSGSNAMYAGVCILYNTLGKSAPGAGVFPTSYNLGRTLTHETGHFFEIWHPWGDDNGKCPWATGGQDDGVSDTPPESDAVYGAPAYTITGGTLNDACQLNGATNTQPIGIACLSYMDYVNDNAMHLFTPMQAAVMASMALVPPGGTGTTAGDGTVGENYTLTQHPELLVECGTTGIAPAPVEINSSLSVYPNPTTGTVNVSINSAVETLNDITVFNLVGQRVMTVSGTKGKDYYSIDLSAMTKGIYFVKCNFESGSVTRKIVLQ